MEENTQIENPQPMEQSPKLDMDILFGGIKGAEGLSTKVAEAIDSNRKAKPKTEPVIPEQKVEVKPKNEQVKTEVKPEVKTETKVNVIPDNPYFEMATEQTSVDFKDINEAFNYITKETGFEVKDVKDISLVVEGYKNLKNEKESLAERTSTLEKYEKYLASLPEDILSVLFAHDSKEDYRQVMLNLVSQTFDFDKSFDKQDDFKVINYYFKDKFSTKEDYLAMKEESPDMLAEYIGFAKMKFNDDKAKYESKKKEVITKTQSTIQESQNKYSESVNKTVSKFSTDYKTFKPEQVKTIQKVLDNGGNGILSLFMNNDGSLKDNAAELVSFVQYGKTLLESQKRMAANQAASKAVEQVVSRGADAPLLDNRAGSGDVSTEKVKAWENAVLPKKDAENPFLK